MAFARPEHGVLEGNEGIMRANFHVGVLTVFAHAKAFKELPWGKMIPKRVSTVFVSKRLYVLYATKSFQSGFLCDSDGDCDLAIWCFVTLAFCRITVVCS